MFQKIQIKRGIKGNLTFPLSLGELAFCTDTKELFIGTSSGNYLIGGSNGGGSTITGSINNGYLIIDGNEIQVYDDSMLNLSKLIDVDLSGNTNGYVLTYNSTTHKFEPRPLPSGIGSGATNLDGLSDVDTTTTPPTEGSILKFSGGIWKPSTSIDLYEDFLGTEIPEIIDTKPPEDVPFISIYNKTTSSFDTAWIDNISKGDVSKYNIYKDNVLIGTQNARQDIRCVQSVTGLSNLTSYNVKVTSVDAKGNESMGTSVVTKTIGTQALSFTGGSSGYVKLPNITFTDIEVFCLIDNQVSDFLIDARNGLIGGYLGRTSTGDAFVGSSWSRVYVDGLPLIGRLPTGVKSSFRVVSDTPVTDDINIFSNSSNGQTMLGKLYTVNVYNRNIIVASYDLTTQFTGTNIIDQSGNNKNATFSGGTWVLG